MYKALGLNPTARAKTQLDPSLKREVLGKLVAARSGHGNFAAYHTRDSNTMKQVYDANVDTEDPKLTNSAVPTQDHLDRKSCLDRVNR